MKTHIEEFKKKYKKGIGRFWIEGACEAILKDVDEIIKYNRKSQLDLTIRRACDYTLGQVIKLIRKGIDNCPQVVSSLEARNSSEPAGTKK